MAKKKSIPKILSVLGGSSEGITTQEELTQKIGKLDILLNRTKARIAMRHKEWMQEIEKMPPREKVLLLKGLALYNLEAKGLES